MTKNVSGVFDFLQRKESYVQMITILKSFHIYNHFKTMKFLFK